MKTKYLILLFLLLCTSAIYATDPWGEPRVLCSSMTVMAAVSIDGIPAEAGDILAAFIHLDGVLQLRGKTPVLLTDAVAACLLQVYTETDDEEILFRVWKHSSQTPKQVVQTLSSEVNGIVGHYPDSLYPVNADSSYLIDDPWGQPQVLPSSMSVMARVHIQDLPASIGDILVATVLVEGEEQLRGKAQIQVVDSVPGCLLQIFIGSILESINFKVWDYDQQHIYNCDNNLAVAMEAAVGSYPDNMYFINPGGLIQQMPPVQIDPASGSYSPTVEISMSCSLADAEIRYTLDGSMPTEESTLYGYPLSLPPNSNASFQAKGFGAGWYPSLMKSASYTITNYVAAPTFYPPAGHYESPIAVQMICATGGAQIRYTRDGTLPTAYSALYIAPIVLSDSTVVKARAFFPDWEPSPMQEAEYIFPVSNANGIQSPVLLGIGSTYPNPFQAQLTIEIKLKDTPQFYVLKVYNLKGECVKTHSGIAQGSFQLEWDGSDANGKRMSTGVYLLSLQTKDTNSIRKVILY